jgi:hypothetical protein
MKEILRYWLLKRFIKDPTLSAEIYQMLYHKKTFIPQTNKWVGLPPITVGIPFIDDVEKPTSTTPKISERKKQLLESLQTLSNKPLKSKQDKESIEILKAVLKNER